MGGGEGWIKIHHYRECIIDNVLLLSIKINCKFNLSKFCAHVLNSHREVLFLIHLTQIRIVILNMSSFQHLGQ